MKDKSQFQTAGGGKWLQPYCKPCDSERKKKHRSKNIERITAKSKERYLSNRVLLSPQERKKTQQIVTSKLNAFNKARTGASKFTAEEKKIKKYLSDKNYRERNAAKIRENKKKYNETIGLEKKKKWQQEKMLDVNFRITKNLRGRIYVALKRGVKSDPTMKLLGCTIDEFKAYFESLFTEGMSWGQYMEGGIHIDHIIPCAKFDLTDPEQQRKCFHYTNLQPLWAVDNLRKGTSIEYKIAS